ncbi:MAG: flagellar basal-body MS-ring/collar protein FliF [Gemmatimonadota bacterium]
MLNGTTLPPLLQQWIDRIGGPRRVALLGIGVLAVVGILGIARWATAPTWVPVYSDIPLENVSVITERLDEQRIAYRLGGNGSELRVATSDLARARVALASEGMPQAGRPGLELFDQPAWGMTDFTQRVNYRRALEGELERTIANMSGVEAVKVHIAMEEAAGFRRNGNPSEASIVMRLRSGASPSQDMVQGITHLVSSSVDGVTADRVMVLDDSGRLLSSPYEDGSPAALASRELEMRSEVEEYLATKAEQLVTQIVGPGNVRVQVSAEINLDRVERTVETVDPERQVLSSEQRSEIIPGAEGGAGSTSVTSTYLNTRSMETYSGAVGNVRRVTAAVLVNDNLIVEDGVGRYEPRAPEQIQQIQTLVASAMGIDPGRGDVISVVSFPFDAGIEIEPETTSAWEIISQFQKPLIALVALVLTFFIAMRLTRTLKQPEAPASAALPAGDKGATVNVLAGGGESGAPELGAPEPEAMLPPAGPTTRDLVATQVEQHPDVAVKMIRSWMKEE